MKIYEIIADDAYIFYAYTDELDIDKELAKVSEYRREKITLLRCENDKKLSLLSEILLVYGLDKLNINCDTPLRFSIGEYGKPQIMGMKDRYFNISHCENIAVCAISTSEIGIDVENINRNSSAAEKCFTEDERRLSQEYSLSYIWTRKEAVAKANGRGIGIGLERFDTSGDDVILDGKVYRLHTISVEDYYISYALL